MSLLILALTAGGIGCEGQIGALPSDTGEHGSATGVLATSELTAASQGLLGSYFTNRDLSGNAFLTRLDDGVVFNWGKGAPAPDMSADHFSVRWTGFVEAPASGATTFTTRSDDGVRLWVDGTKIIDNWTDHAPRDDHGVIQLVAGQRYPLQLEYFERGGGAVMQLSWSYAGTARTLVPSARLFPTNESPSAPPSVPAESPAPAPAPTPAPAPAPLPTSAQSGCARPAALLDVSQPNQVVGNGTPESCTEAALDRALAVGGIITFKCGEAPFTFKLTTGKSLRKDLDTTIDGAGKITFDGQSQVRPLKLDHWFDRATPLVRVQRMRFINGKSTGSPHPAGLGSDTDGGGGAIYLSGGSLVVIDSQFENNACPIEGPDVGGGAIYGVGTGKIAIVGSHITRNRCANGGAVGALFMAMTIVDTTLIANEATGHGANWADGTAQHGRGGNGGALVMDGQGDRLELCGVNISNNVGGAFGGAIFQTAYKDTQRTIIDRSLIRGNSIRPQTDAAGAGGLYLQGSKVTITASTIADNKSQFIGGLWVHNHGAVAATLDMTNVTITGNDNSGWGGAGIELQGVTPGTWNNVTVASNTGGHNNPGVSGIAYVTIMNSILAGGCSGTANGQRNLQWPASGAECVAAAVRADPVLGGLAANGGVTPTLLPVSSSPAAGMGASCATTDQRGTVRASACTLGAVEIH